MTTANLDRGRALGLFLKDLRSGAFAQTYFVLRRAALDGLCEYSAAGVACCTYAAATGKGSWVDNTFVTSGGKSDILLPKCVADWLGFNSTDPTLEVTLKYKDLRPEMEHLTRNDLQQAESSGDDDVIERARHARKIWEEIRGKTYGGVETFSGLNDFLMMRLDQIASVLQQHMRASLSVRDFVQLATTDADDPSLEPMF